MMLRDLAGDLRYAFRLLVKNPGFTAVAVFALALGVGANTSIFSLVNAFFLRPLPVEDPARLVHVAARWADTARTLSLSYPDFIDYRDRNTVLSGMLAYHPIPIALAAGGEPERVQGQIVTGNYFGLLGVRPALGRVFTAQEDRAPGAAPVAVIAQALWKRSFGSDPDVPGRVVLLNGRPFTVIGVAPPGFTGTVLGEPADIWVPFAMQEQAAPALGDSMTSRGASWLRVIGRLKPGVATGQARAGLEVIARQIEREHPAERRGINAVVAPLRGGVHPGDVGEALPIAGLLMAVTFTVLFIACFNVANLLLARAAARRREIGIRLALGATRGRLTRQLLAESTLLAVFGAGGGLLFAIWMPEFLSAFTALPPDIPAALRLDLRVLLFTLALALATGVLAGLAPALAASRPDTAPALKNEPASAAGGHGRIRLQGLFVVAQVALSLVLLVSAGLFLRSLGKAAAVDPGFDTDTTLEVAFDLRTHGYSKEKSRLFCRDLLDRVEAQPGVRSATLASLVPLSGRMIGLEAIREEDAGLDASGSVVYANIVWPGYFRTMGIPLLRGRDFTSQDREGAPGVVIVNETMARRLFEQRDPLGRRIGVDGPLGPWLEVVGVARDSRYDELTEDPRPFVYLPHLQNRDLLPELVLIVSVEGDPASALAPVQREVRSMDATLPVFGAATLAQHVRQRNDKQQAITKMLGLFGALALILASMGLYGVMAYAVGRRTREIGIRMALGARTEQVAGLFVREGLRLAMIGIAAGSALALALTRVLSSMLFGVTPTDTITFAAVAALLAGVAAAASWLPARRAARVDPMIALRHE